MLEGQGVEVDLLGPAVGLVGHRAAAAPAEETPDPGRGGIDGWRLAGEAEGAARHAEEGGDRRGGIASAALAVSIGAPVLRTVELVGDLAAEAAAARRHHASSRSPLDRKSTRLNSCH